PMLEQLALADFIAGGHFARHLRKMRLLYLERRDTLVATLRRELGDLVDVGVPEAGMHLVAWLPEGMSARTVAQRAAAQGLHALPIVSDDQRPYSRDGLMLGFASDTPAALRAGVRRLARLVRGQP
ncbi:MAG TPA: PLP-dependent aminotransferase family protein, partial [Ktedonobacterales bacterium]|nr:PLP-dependent aminotransferase family protein [Ktedonobacterales bacterium]